MESKFPKKITVKDLNKMSIKKRENKFHLYLGNIYLGSFLTEQDAIESCEDLILESSYK